MLDRLSILESSQNWSVVALAKWTENTLDGAERSCSAAFYSASEELA